MTYIGRHILKKIANSSNRLSNPQEFLPEDEIHTLKQVFFLIMMAFSFAVVLYSLIFINDRMFYFFVFDIIFSWVIAINLDLSSNKNRIMLLLLIPYASLTCLFFDNFTIRILDTIHVLVLLYFVKVYYDKFKEYTEVNQLGTTILLLFVIIFVSFFITQLVEHVNPLDSFLMVSNAFTSNGYAVLGTTVPGKLNSIFLVWGGYIISGAGTATLTAAILIRYFNKRVRQLEKLIDDGSGEE